MFCVYLNSIFHFVKIHIVYSKNISLGFFFIFKKSIFYTLSMLSSQEITLILIRREYHIHFDKKLNLYQKNLYFPIKPFNQYVYLDIKVFICKKKYILASAQNNCCILKNDFFLIKLCVYIEIYSKWKLNGIRKELIIENHLAQLVAFENVENLKEPQFLIKTFKRNE